MNQEILAKAAAIVEQNTGESSYCNLAQIDLDGYPTVSTITPAKADGIKTITFATSLSSNKVKRIKKNALSCVSFNSMEYNITLIGKIEVLTETEIKNETWYSGLIDHFSGPEDPDYCVLRFHTERYRLLIDWTELNDSLSE